MSTSEYRSIDAESDLPISATELAALASQLFAASVRPGPDSPPQASPVAPRGNVPDTTAAASAGTAAAGSANPFTPAAPVIPLTDVYVPAPTSPEPDGIPQTVPVAPRGNVPDAASAPSAAYTVESALDPYAVPTSGIVPTIPGVLAGSTPTVPVAPRGSVPGWLPGAPTIGDLGWSDAPMAAPVGDEANYYFLTGPAISDVPAEPVPQLPDEHEVFDVNAVRADFPILRETVNGKPLIWFDNAATTQKPQVGHRPAVLLLRPRELQHPPRRARAGRAGHRRLRGSPRHRAALHRRVEERGDHLRARHHRGDQPGRLRLGRQAPGTGRRDRHHPPGAPREHRSLAAAFAADRRGPAGRAGRRRGQPADVGVRGSVSARRPNWLLPPRSRTRWARSRRCTEDRRARAPLRRAGADRRRAVDPAHSRSTCRQLGADFFVFSGPQDLRPHRHRRALRHARTRSRKRRRGRAAAT